MKIQESGEMYIETIYLLSKRGAVRSIDIAERLGYSRPSVSRAIRVLEKDGFLTIGEKTSIYLTEAGKKIAEKLYDRHQVLTQFLCELGVDKDIAEMDACRIEHVIGADSFEAIKKYMSSIKTE